MKRKAATQKTPKKDKKSKKSPVTRHQGGGNKSNLPAAWNPVGSEIKAVDLLPQNYVINVGGGGSETVILLNGVQTGAGFFNRVGARIEMRNLHVRGLLRNIATGIQDVMRMAIVYDRQPVGTLPVFTDIFLARTQTGATSGTGVAEVNLDNRDRFIILRDLEIYMPSVSNAANVLTNGPNYPGSDQESDINMFIKLKGLGTHFKSSSNPTTIGDIATGALYMICFGYAQSGSWQLQLGFRMRYDDK